jgi:hypothetical protein
MRWPPFPIEDPLTESQINNINNAMTTGETARRRALKASELAKDAIRKIFNEDVVRRLLIAVNGLSTDEECDTLIILEVVRSMRVARGQIIGSTDTAWSSEPRHQDSPWTEQ